MARRSRDNRTANLGYDEQRPSRDERRLEHRRARHTAHQMLHTLADPDELEPLPQVRRTHEYEPVSDLPIERRRFKVWKTKFWKRRDSYRDMRANLDSRWLEMEEPVEEW
jgi:hypothetical protein